jgi:hypothetical protein
LYDCEIISGTTSLVSVRANAVDKHPRVLSLHRAFGPMAKPLQLSLSEEQREELIDV